MPSPKNRVIFAAAGSGKTTELVNEALALASSRILFTTYTLENLWQIREKFTRHAGSVPTNVALRSWYSFLLQDLVRPYQRSLTARPRVRSINFRDLPDEARFAKKATQKDRYYLTASGRIHRDRVSEFATEANAATKAAVMRRLERIYDYVFIDELQDLVGYDLEVLDALFSSTISVSCVGDPRQFTYSTNRSTKNKAFRGPELLRWLEQTPRCHNIALQTRVVSHRCNAAICEFADGLFPAMPTTIAGNTTPSGHDGIFRIPRTAVEEYVQDHAPMILRHDRKTDTCGLAAMNFGASKGQTFDHVLIFPTGPMKRYLKSGDPTTAGDLARFYVAVTRAKHSVAFVVD